MDLDLAYFQLLRADALLEIAAKANDFVQRLKQPLDCAALVKLINDIHHYYAQSDDIMRNCFAKVSFNEFLGWTIPSIDIIQTIITLQLNTRLPVYDLGSGRGLLLLLLRRSGCNVFGVDLTQPTHPGDTDVPLICPPDILYSGKDADVIPIRSILLICWGSGCHEQLESYIRRGGKHVVIIGEDGDGCTLSANYFKDNHIAGWSTTQMNVPNFFGIHTFMTINIRN